MADRTNDERLRELTAIAARERARVEEIKRLRAELDAARETIRSKDRLLPSLIAEGVAMELERAATAEAEVERLRADLRCALRLLGEAWSEGAGDASWSRETFALLAKHKETP